MTRSPTFRPGTTSNISIKQFSVVSLCVAAALGVGWIWGASGKAALDHQKARVEAQLHFEKARALVLDGRLTLVGNDYTRAGESFKTAAGELEALQRMLREVGQAEIAGRIEIVLSHLKAAREAAAAQNANAWSAADAALQALKGIQLPE